MRRLLVLSLVATLGTGIGLASSASATPRAASPQFTCVYFSNPTVEYVWSHVCRF
jgi:hypothetical protein